MDTIIARYESQSEGPKYKQLSEAIRGAVVAKDLVPGEKLPPVRDLAWALKITPGTVARAYSILTQDGVLAAAVGRGTFVADSNLTEMTVPLPSEAAPDSDAVSFASPRLPDCGQVAMIQAAFSKIAQCDAHDLLNYPTRAGFRPARKAVANWLRDTPIGHVTHEDIVLSHGAQNGNSLVMQSVLTGPKPVVLLEDLSYPGFRRSADLLRAEVVGVPMDRHGIVPEALERIVRSTGAQLLCTSPEVHNPTVTHTPTFRREEIARVAERTGLQLLEDDCYRLGKADAPHYRAILPDQSWYVSSISKTLTPALRVGFAVAPIGAQSQLRRAAEHGFFGLARPLADVVERILTDPRIWDVAEAVRETINRYIRAAVNILGGYDLEWRENVPIIWLRLPEGWRAGALVQAADNLGVTIRSAEDFALRDARSPHAVRLGINAQVSQRSFEAALHRLRELLDNPPERIAV